MPHSAEPQAPSWNLFELEEAFVTITQFARTIVGHLPLPHPDDEPAAVALEQANQADWTDDQLGSLKDEMTRARLDRLRQRAGMPRA